MTQTLAIQGVHPNVIKTVMRHSTITLTMDTYGHLLPDQHADAVVGMAAMLENSTMRAAVTVQKEVHDNATECDEMRNESIGEGVGLDPPYVLRLCANPCTTMLQK